jgi:hypothetical protein
MSRFDRRLKGPGLRPGESTCALENIPVANYASMNWNQANNNFTSQMQNNMSNLRTAQRSSIQGAVSSLNESPLLSRNHSTLSQPNEADALEIKNARLQNVASTTTDSNLRLLSLHEIRLNRLEFNTLKKTDFGNISNDEIHKGLFENKMAHMENKLKLLFDTTTNEMKIRYKSLQDNYNIKIVELKEINERLEKKITMLENDITRLQVKKEVHEEIRKDPTAKILNDEKNKIEFKIEDKRIYNIPFETNNQDAEIKKMVKEAIEKVEKEN